MSFNSIFLGKSEIESLKIREPYETQNPASKTYSNQQLTFIQSKHAKSFQSVSREKNVQNKLLTFDENVNGTEIAWGKSRKQPFNF